MTETPEARPSREERLARLSPEDRAAVEVWSLGRRARDLAAAGDPDAPAAEAAYREAEASAIEAEILMRRVDVEDLKARHPVLARDAEVTVGVGWQLLLEGLLDRLAGMSVVVPLVREKFGGLDAKVYPVGAWVHAEFDAMDGIKEPAKEAALRTCEALRGAEHHAAGRAVADAVRPARRDVRRLQNSCKKSVGFSALPLGLPGPARRTQLTRQVGRLQRPHEAPGELSRDGGHLRQGVPKRRPQGVARVTVRGREKMAMRVRSGKLFESGPDDTIVRKVG